MPGASGTAVGVHPIPSPPVDTFLDPHPEWIAVGGPDHLTYVAGLLVLAVALIVGRRWVREHATLVRRIVLGVVVVQQCTLYGFYALTGWDWAESMPLLGSLATERFAQGSGKKTKTVCHCSRSCPC